MDTIKRKKYVILSIVLVIAAICFGYWLMTRGYEHTDDAQIEAHVVPIAPRVAGYVVTLNVTDNQVVKKGQLLLSIDPMDYQIKLAQMQADLETARAQASEAEANWQRADADLRRLRGMGENARSRKQLDDATALEKSAASGVEALTAAVKRSEADVLEAQKNLRDTQIIAPIDGRVAKRGVEMGAYVQPGQQLLALVGNDYWVVANFKETQVAKMRSGQNVSIHIDAYPGQDYQGKVESLQTGTGARFSTFPPENATGNFVKIVQRVPVKILFTERPDTSLAIGPGMSVVPKVKIE